MIDEEKVTKYLNFLRKELKIERDPDIKIILLQLLEKLAQDPLVDGTIIIEDLIHEVYVPRITPEYTPTEITGEGKFS